MISGIPRRSSTTTTGVVAAAKTCRVAVTSLRGIVDTATTATSRMAARAEMAFNDRNRRNLCFRLERTAGHLIRSERSTTDRRSEARHRAVRLIDHATISRRASADEEIVVPSRMPNRDHRIGGINLARDRREAKVHRRSGGQGAEARTARARRTSAIRALVVRHPENSLTRRNSAVVRHRVLRDPLRPKRMVAARDSVRRCLAVAATNRPIIQ